MDWQSVGTIIGAVTGSQVLTTYIQNKAMAKKTDADAASTLVQSMLEWQKTLTDRIAALEKAVNDKDKKIEDLQARIVHLETEMSKMENTNLCS